MTKAELQAEIDRLKVKCDKQALILRQLMSQPDIMFICGVGGKWRDGLPEQIHVSPAYGVDWFEVYSRDEGTDK